jgi:hypothetical protein
LQRTGFFSAIVTVQDSMIAARIVTWSVRFAHPPKGLVR